MEISFQSLDLFPTRIWQFDLSYLSPRFPSWQQRLEAWRADEPIAAGRSNRSGWNSDKTQFVQVKPRPGLLLLFPNWLEHAVETNEAGTQRHAIAMNALQVV